MSRLADTHQEALAGRTARGTPVFVVAVPRLTRSFPDEPPLRVFELPVAEVPEMLAREPASEPARALENS